MRNRENSPKKPSLFGFSTTAEKTCLRSNNNPGILRASGARREAATKLVSYFRRLAAARCGTLKESLIKTIFSVLLAVVLLNVFVTVSFAHDMALIMGSSEWVFKKNSIKAMLTLDPVLIESMKQVKAKGFQINEIDKTELKWIATEIMQPYINQQLTVRINGRKYPVKVESVDTDQDVFYLVSIAIDNIALKKETNRVQLKYNLFFKETGGDHMNFATFASASERKKIEFDFTSKGSTWEGALDKSGVLRGANDVLPGQKNLGSQKNAEASKNWWRTFKQFNLLGIKHILTGYDHILFLIALLVIGLSFKGTFHIISSFTIAHSLTLFLTATKIISLNARLVESVIAISICYVALENIFRKEIKYRWLVTFGFGLIHGFGFASILGNYMMDEGSLIYSILSFNIGVEIGQLLIFLVILPLLYFINKKFIFRKVTINTSIVIFVLGFVWLVERLFDFKLL